MAKEINFTATLNLTNGGLTFSRTFSRQIDQTSARYAANTQTITTTAVALTIPTDITTPGVCLFVNQDTTNYVELGTSSGGTFAVFMRLNPGEGYPVRLGTAAPYAKAHTASVNVECVYLAD